MKVYRINFPEDEGRKYNSFKYPAGETQVRLTHDTCIAMSDADEVHVIARITDGDIMPLALLTDALFGERYTARSPKYVLILPYLPYSRADRRFVDGDCFGLKTFGKLINMLAYDQVVTLDAHSYKAKQYISNLVDVSPVSIIKDIVTPLPLNTLILLPDEGSFKRYDLSSIPNFVDNAEKVRDPESGRLSGFEVPEQIARFGERDYREEQVENVLIVDDICDGGGTFLGIAEKIDPGINLYLYVTHGIFSKGVHNLLNRFKHIYTTDSVPWLFHESVTIIPCEGYIASKLMNTKDLFQNAIK